MKMRKRPPETISRAFKQDFPDQAARAAALGVKISLRTEPRAGRVYWLDGYRQLTGYDTRSDGRPFTRDDAVKHIDKVLAEIERDRAEAAGMTTAERFARVMAEMRRVQPRYRMIGEVRIPNGDRGHCFFNAEFAGGVRLEGVGDVAKAAAEWRRDESAAAQMARFCDLLEADFAQWAPR